MTNIWTATLTHKTWTINNNLLLQMHCTELFSTNVLFFFVAKSAHGGLKNSLVAAVVFFSLFFQSLKCMYVKWSLLLILCMYLEDNFFFVEIFFLLNLVFHTIQFSCFHFNLVDIYIWRKKAALILRKVLSFFSSLWSPPKQWTEIFKVFFLCVLWIKEQKNLYKIILSLSVFFYEFYALKAEKKSAGGFVDL